MTLNSKQLWDLFKLVKNNAGKTLIGQKNKRMEAFGDIICPPSAAYFQIVQDFEYPDEREPHYADCT